METNKQSLSLTAVHGNNIDRRFVWLTDSKVIYFVFAASVVLSISIGSYYRTIGDFSVENDFFAEYLPEAENILQGTLPIDDYRGPVYPILLAVFSFLFHDLFVTGKLLSSLASGLFLWLSYQLIRVIVNAKAAILVTGLILINASFIKYSYTAGTDMLFATIAMGLVYLLITPDQLSNRRMLLCGFLAGVAYLTRYNGVVFLIVIPILLLTLRQYGNSIRVRLIRVGYFILPAMILIIAWGFYCLNEKGLFFYNKNYINTAFEIFGAGKIPYPHFFSIEARQFNSFFDVFSYAPTEVLTRIGTNLYRHLFDDAGLTIFKDRSVSLAYGLNYLFSAPLGLMSIVGLVVLVRSRPKGKLLNFAIISVCFYCFLALVFYVSRYSLFLLPFYGVAIYFFLQWVKTLDVCKNSPDLPAIVFSIALLYTAIESIWSIRYDIRKLPWLLFDVRESVLRSGVAIGEGDRIASNTPHLAYLFHAENIGLPTTKTLGELLLRLHRLDVDYLYFSKRESIVSPELSPLTYSKFKIKDLELIYENEFYEAKLYRYRKTLDAITITKPDLGTISIHDITTKKLAFGNETRYDIPIDSIRTTTNAITGIDNYRNGYLRAKDSLWLDIRLQPKATGFIRDTVFIYNQTQTSPALVLVSCRGVDSK